MQPARPDWKGPAGGRLRASAAVTVAAIAALSLASCGEGSDREQIERAIAAKFASADPAACTDHATERFLEQLEGVPGRVAVEVCKRNADARGAVADSVEVPSLRIKGPRATARVAIHGSRLDGQTPTLRLVNQDGAWRIDAIAGLRLAGRLLNQFERRFRREVLSRTRLTRSQADCILERIEGDLSSAELTDLAADRLPAGLRSRIEAATRACAAAR